MSIEDLLAYIDNVIDERGLSLTNKEAYIQFRADYNASAIKDPIDLLILTFYSFNHQFRFNSAHEFNCPFGKDRSCFNAAIRQNLIKFHNGIQNIIFSANDFIEFDYSVLNDGDFLYADPPYLITTGSYNDGKRGFKGWSKDNDAQLFSILDELNRRNVRFAMSNVLEHKGQKNTELIAWAEQYHIHTLDFGYGNASYHATKRTAKTKEVLITNYDI